MAAAGDPDRAETVARSITTSSRQERVLTAVAGAIAVAGDLEGAGRLLGGVLAVASWPGLWSVLARHWPQVVLRHVDELSGNSRSRYTEGT